MSETTITRRAALTTGTLTALGVGLLAAAGARPEPVAAEPLAVPTVLPTVVCPDDLAADCRALLAQLREEEAAYWAAVRDLEATLSPAQAKLWSTLSDATSDKDCTVHEWISAEMARHAPGLSTVIRLLWLHVIAEGTDCRSFCCTPAEGYEP